MSFVSQKPLETKCSQLSSRLPTTWQFQIESLIKHARFWDVDRTATGREHSVCQDSGVSHIFIVIIHNGEKVLSIVNVMVWSRVIRENSSLPLAVRVSKSRVLKLPFIHQTRSLVWFHYCSSECSAFAAGTLIWVVHISRIPDREAKNSASHAKVFGESRFPESSEFPNPVSKVCVFPNSAPYFDQIPDPGDGFPKHVLTI